MNDYPEDTFTEADVLRCLDRANLKYKDGHRYIVSQCPTHDDKNPSTQIFKDDWFVNCLAGCGRYHITKAFPELLPERDQERRAEHVARRGVKMPEPKQYKQFDLTEWWQGLPMIPRDHVFKNGTISLETLDSMGWRWDEPKNSYFIPYFSASETFVPFGQWRHLAGDRRFTFLHDAKPTCYGTWNLHGNSKLFVVEGASDAAVLHQIMVPWLALPSASSGELMKAAAQYCKENHIELVYAGDKDEAGDKLKEALSSVMPFRTRQVPKPYKDWGEFLIGTDEKTVCDYAHAELFRGMAAADDSAPDWVNEAKEQLGLL